MKKKLSLGIGIIIAVSMLIFLIPLGVSAANQGAINNSCTGNNSATYNMTSSSMMNNMSTMMNSNMMGNSNMMSSMMNQNMIGTNLMAIMLQGALNPDIGLTNLFIKAQILGINQIQKWSQDWYGNYASLPNNVSFNSSPSQNSSGNTTDHASHHR